MGISAIRWITRWMRCLGRGTARRAPTRITHQIRETATIPAELEAYWKQLDCGFPRVEPVFADCMHEALSTLSKQGVDAYIEHARFLGKMGRGAEPILIFLE